MQVQVDPKFIPYLSKPFFPPALYENIMKMCDNFNKALLQGDIKFNVPRIGDQYE